MRATFPTVGSVSVIAMMVWSFLLLLSGMTP